MDFTNVNNPAARCIIAMCRFKQGNAAEARSNFEKVKGEMKRVESQIDESGFPPIGTWFSWAIVRILAREAESMGV